MLRIWGVSKASVSKWETAQSYPDITFLPQLAAYFNISIDELMGYSPQMTKEDIKKFYHHLSSKFSNQPFDEVLVECRAHIKKYYSCFPFLLQMGLLLMNHYMLAKKTETQQELLHEMIGLFVRIKTESEDVWLSKQANCLEAMCYMYLQQPQEVLELLDGTMKPISSEEAILASAYQMTGNTQKANEVLQVSIYQHALILASDLNSFILLYVNEVDKFEMILQRILSIADVFHLDTLHPNTALQIYFAAAHGYATQGNSEKALDMLSKYADVSTSYLFPLSLHGDEFFDGIDNWFHEFDLGENAPRDEKVVKESILQSVISNPAFSSLTELPRYKSIVDTLKGKLGV